MEIISVHPRGYCQGVARAIRIAYETVQKHPGEPVTMLGMIVHNAHVVKACEDLGIRCLEDPRRTRLELLDDIDSGIVILTAHGVSDAVYEKARAKGLQIVDATCPDVARTHDLVKQHVRTGDVLYIGKPHHPEAEGVVGLSERVHLISRPEDLEKLGPLRQVLITNQTTLSKLDVQDLVRACLQKYPDAEVADEICQATSVRQQAVLDLKDVDLLIVVGDPHSNNSNQLRELGARAGIPRALLIGDAQELDPRELRQVSRVAVTSGSSTPTALTEQVLSALHTYAETGSWIIPDLPQDPLL